MNKEELRGKFIKEIPKQIIKGEQLSYADWLEQLIVSGYVVKNNAVLRSVMPSLHIFKERREKLNMTLREVARITHVSAATISRIERGHGECSYHNVVQLDDFYCRNGA